MTDTIIEVENLGKRYVLDHQQEREQYTALRDVIAKGVKSALKGFSRQKTETKEEFWALKDVSFEVKRGEVVGIIGRNGAGKSTLLKILSRITEPTTGRVRLKGRVASLLEVGTGFHPELTGRENIYLNGAVLGMMREEIDRKFDEIVAFAEVEKFLDTPVKRYSSGMYVRLAFAVAAHLEPEILIVDEVLAVGDAAFQKKCLGKMGDVASKEGRTVLFVSHNMAAVNRLCKRGVYLEKGEIELYSDVNSVVDFYLQKNLPNISWYKNLINEYREGNYGRYFKITFVEIIPNENNLLHYNEPLMIKISGKAYKDIESLILGVGVATMDGTRLFTVECSSNIFSSVTSNLSFAARVKIPHPSLVPGTYVLAIGARTVHSTLALDYIPNAIVFEVSNSVETTAITNYHGLGLMLSADWEVLNC